MALESHAGSGSPFGVDQASASQQMEQVPRTLAMCLFRSVALRRGLSHGINFSHFCSMNGQNVHQHPDLTQCVYSFLMALACREVQNDYSGLRKAWGVVEGLQSPGKFLPFSACGAVFRPGL